MTHADHITIRCSHPQDLTAVAEPSELERAWEGTILSGRFPLTRQVISLRGRRRGSRLAIGAWVSLVCALALAAPGNALAGEKAGGAPIADWMHLTLNEIAGHRVNPPRASRALALVSVALEHSSRKGVPQIHGAAAEVLGYLFPDRRQLFDQRAADLASSASNLRRGRAIGARVVDRGRSDRADTYYTGTRPSGVGYWSDGPGVAGPLEPAAAQWLPWNMRNGAEFRPPPPPSPGDAEYPAEIQLVYDASQRLTATERALALFWADGAGTETPPGHWNRIALDLVSAKRLPARAAARTFALLNTAQADAFIAAWDAKYAYWSERPVQAIRRTIDPNWSPLIPTPPFPGYVSGHSTTSGAASVVLGALFPSEARDLAEMADEAAISRLYGGIHYPIDNDTGLLLGQRVGGAALDRH